MVHWWYTNHLCTHCTARAEVYLFLHLEPPLLRVVGDGTESKVQWEVARHHFHPMIEDGFVPVISTLLQCTYEDIFGRTTNHETTLPASFP